MITEQDLNRQIRRINVIFYIMLVSLAVYLYVGLTVGQNAQASGENYATLRMGLYGISFIILLITRPVRKAILRKNVQGTEQGLSFQHPVILKYLRATIISAALSEAIGIYGLVLCILGKNPVDLYILIAIAAAAMIQYRPKREELMSLFNENQGTQY